MARLNLFRFCFSIALVSLLSGCIASALQDLSASLASAVLDQNDVGVVREGLPAYLLMTDGLIESHPEEAGLLLAGAKLYAFYATSLVTDAERARKLTDKARSYADRALCFKLPDLCDIRTMRFELVEPALAEVERDDAGALYIEGLAWLAWLKAHSRDWDAVADRPKIEALFERVVALDETYDSGRAHYYLGILRTQLPPSLGGKPEIGRKHFERAIELSGGLDLAVKVALARYYARMLFDRELHDRLLREVLTANAEEPGLTLSNTLAQQDARLLLDESSSYFEE